MSVYIGKVETVGRAVLATPLLALLLVSVGCSDDDSPTSPTNRAPGDFTVTAASTSSGATISWTDAIDPDGDAVSYSLVVDADTLLTGASVTQHTVSNLAPETAYSGQVLASDTAGLQTTRDFTFTTELEPNQPPAAFAPTSPGNGFASQIAPVFLQWQASVDPDGDAVLYDVFLDGTNPPSTMIATGISATSFSFPGDALESGASYSWRVVARDGNGGVTDSPVFTFTMQTVMTLATDEPGWDERYAHTAVSFQGRLWVMGGERAGGTHFGDVWSSADGVSWQEEVADAPWGSRSRHGAVVFGGKLWIIGGKSFASNSALADVWSSVNGVDWNEETADAGFTARFEHDTVVYDSKMWVLGGTDFASTAETRTVWNSTDGVTWTEVSPFTFNISGRAVVFDDKIWYLGGFSSAARWTTDGITWTTATADAAWGERVYPSVTAHDGRLWLLSGSDNAINQYTELPDIWSSVDGETWTLVSDDAGFDPVAFGQVVSHDAKLWLLGGGGGFGGNFTTNDVWVLD